jgi:ribosomal-protein-serine acetyltransferase
MRTELSNERIRIRRYCAADIPLVFAAARESINEMVDWMPWCHQNYSLEETTAFILSCEAAWNQKKEFGFAILDARTDEFLGGVGLNQFNHEHSFANLGYWVRTSSTGRGVATGATLLAARLAFEDLNLRRVEIVAAVGNVASQRVAEKARARREGVLRNRLFIHGRPHDAVMFSLVAADLKP